MSHFDFHCSDKNTLGQSSFGGKDLFGSQLQITVGIEGSQGRNMKAALLATPHNINPNQKTIVRFMEGFSNRKKISYSSNTNAKQEEYQN